MGRLAPLPGLPRCVPSAIASSAFVLALGVLVALLPGARAGPYEDALLRFTADSFNETIEGVNEVAASGSPLAATVIGALQEGRLLFSAESRRVFIRDPSDRLVDAATGQAWPAVAHPISRRSGSTIACDGSSRPPSAA